MRLLIGSDVVPTSYNENHFINGDRKALLGNELDSIWGSVDIRIFNLEVPLTNQQNPILKNGPNLIASVETINGIKSLEPSLITLANNHILDQGEQGLYSTIKLLKQNNIPFIGAGKNLIEASKPYVFNLKGKSVGIYACAENEFTIATKNTPGANPFDPLESLDHILNLKKNCDYVIVLYHGGKEHYRYPSPYLQKVCRKIVEKGADVVICQHSHCIGCFEYYLDSTIIYGQGNFIFNKLDNEFWNTSLLVQIDISEKISVDYVPIVRTIDGTRLANKQESQKIISDFIERSEKIKDGSFIEREYLVYSQRQIDNYLRKLSGFGKWASILDRKLLNGLLIKNKYSREDLLRIINYINCEAHRELLLKGLEGKIQSGRQ